jgi:hypothetical protein
MTSDDAAPAQAGRVCEKVIHVIAELTASMVRG